jgi:[protein-PII] uridylyltransferase
MVAPDTRGLLSKAAGVLALNSLRVHSASVNSFEGSAINTFVVSPHFGSPPPAELLRQQLISAIAGDLDVISLLEQRNAEAAQHGRRAGEVVAAVPVNHASAPPRVLWHDGPARGQLLVEIRSTDRTGLLAVLTRVFEKAGVDIAWAKVTTLGSSVDDVFCVVAPSGESLRTTLEHDLLSVLPAPRRPAQHAS